MTEIKYRLFWSHSKTRYWRGNSKEGQQEEDNDAHGKITSIVGVCENLKLGQEMAPHQLIVFLTCFCLRVATSFHPFSRETAFFFQFFV